MIYSKGSYLAELLDPVVQATHDFGIVAKAFGDLIPNDYDEDEVDEETEGKLSLVHFYIPYMFLLGSLAVSSTILGIEFFWRRFAKKITQNEIIYDGSQMHVNLPIEAE